MKLKLFLIITALLASYPASAFADDLDEEMLEFNDDIFNVEFTDFSAFEDEAQLFGDTVAWDGITLAEVIPEDGVYHIYNGAQLAWIAEQVNTPDSGGMVDCVISIEADIDLADCNWTPIGYSYATPFAGTVNGNGYTVSNLNFDSSSYTHGGLFGCVIGKISNLNVSGNIETSRCLTPSASDPSKNGIGILAGSLDARRFDYNHKDYVGVIEGCSVDGSLTVNNSYGEAFYIGGIVGMNSGGELNDNFAFANISVVSTDTNGTDEAFVGGIAGYNAGSYTGKGTYLLSNKEESNISLLAAAPCDSFCTISVQSANPSLGGIVGGNSGTIIAAISESEFKLTKQPSVFDDNYANVGGVAGINTGNIEHSIDVGDINFECNSFDENSQLNAGMVCGLMHGEINEDGEVVSTAIISDSFSGATINISANTQKNIGGVIGMISNPAGIITDCSNQTDITIADSLYRANTGGIAGVSYGVIDSCESLSSHTILQTSVSSSVGSIAGISYNTISDCKASDNTLTFTSDSPMAVLYSGGIAGETYGRIRRCTANDTISVSGALAYAGGIAGRAELNDEKSIIYGDGEGLISKCTSDADISCSNVAGGIVGDAYNVLIQRSNSNSNISDAVGAGGIAGRAASTTIENCMVNGTISAATSSGAAYEFTNSNNRIPMSYIAPTFAGEVNHAISIADTARYKTQRSYLNTDVTKTDTVEGITAVTNDTAKLRSTFSELNFDSIWTMNDTNPALQYQTNSNAQNSVGEITETRMYFNVSLENPEVGQHVYIALYDIDDRFCGTVSAICTEENINSTRTRADFPLEYSYDYYNYETWEKAEGLPFKYKAFTWDEENGMKSLSSVEEGILTYSFE